MNIAIVGSSGYIAGYLIKRFSDNCFIENVLCIDQTEQADRYLDLSDPRIFDYDSLSCIDYVIFTAAISGPDQCASDFETCWDINVTGTIHFIREAVRKNCKIIFFSSDAVFGNDMGEVYTELSETRAVTPYGKMKKAVEDEFRDIPEVKCIRLSYVVSAKDRFVSYCLSCMEKNEIADIYHPFYRNCISVSDVVDAVDWLISHWQEYEPYILNLAGKELVSRVRIADEINRHMGNCLRYQITRPDDGFYRNRPETTQMQSIYLQKYHILDDNTFTEKIKKELGRIHNE